jgi:mRNA export factor
LSFSPVSGHLSVASWDNKVYIYEVNEDGSNQGKTMMDLKAPALSTCWSKVCCIPSRHSAHTCSS